MKSLPVQRIPNRGRFAEYPALKNMNTGQIYVDVTCGLPRFLTADIAGLNRCGEFVGFNVPGAWTTWNGQEPECPISFDCVFELIEERNAVTA